ncbi:MAG: ribosome recycling factor [Dehalococcoidia bacterium]|nr:ribosome recycling factor [Dehalococcoidia bacterium]
MVEEILAQTNTRMLKAIDNLSKELAVIRTGRASPALIEHIRADYYGVPTPLSQMASISVPEARLLVIQPWDRSALHGIEKAILKSELGLNPVNDGSVIRLNIPQLTEERRQELAKVVRKRVEDGKIGLRNIRREALEHMKADEKEKRLPQDEYHRGAEQLQKVTDKYIAEADSLGETKQAELTEF